MGQLDVRSLAGSVVLVGLAVIVLTTGGCEGLFSDLDDLEHPGELDAGQDVCVPQTDEEFCEAIGTACGTAIGIDNCGEERTVHCEGFEQFGCRQPAECVEIDVGDDEMTGECQCPELVDSDRDAELCSYADAECGQLDAGEVCDDWEVIGTVDCGECDGDEVCGEEFANVCGCPCEIDGQCYRQGAQKAPDEPCMVCDPEQSTDTFTEIAGTPCGTECVDTDDNPDHCGACGRACIAGAPDVVTGCEEGVCTGWCEDATLCGSPCEDDFDCPGATSCVGGQCADECVDIEDDAHHCGTCGNVCTTTVAGAEAYCAEGTCQAECDGEDQLCGDRCVDTDVNTAHCGECDNACGPREDCEGGTCVCAEGYSECSGECVDTDTSPDHCGGCNDTCDGDRVCAAGSCEDECPSGYADCLGACVDTDESIDHCGACSQSCEADVQGASPVCQQGDCGLECDLSQDTMCDQGSEPVCVDLETDINHCGSCGEECSGDIQGAVTVCEDGGCGQVCTDDDATLCPDHGVCANTDIDANHCGACGNACTTDISGAVAVCDGDGECTEKCSAGNETICGDRCVDTTLDDQHCGACGQSCGPHQTCDDGECVCADGRIDCGGECVDIESNPDHCGGCDDACPEDRVCTDGVCESECPENKSPCDGACVDTDDHIDHCGSCDNGCPDDVEYGSPMCDDGQCAVTCDDQSHELCEDVQRCIDTDDHDDHCGECGRSCDTGEYCSDGECICDPDYACCTDDDCAQQQLCHVRNCVDSCDFDLDCELDARCRDGRCIPLECDDIDCPADQACYRGECYDSCSSSTDCADGSDCLEEACVPDDDQCDNLECRQFDCPADQPTTTLTGTVHIPSGEFPLPNVDVFVPNDEIESLPEGTSCGQCDELISGDPLVADVTDVKGRFELEDVPVADEVPVVIQVGKWRRQIEVEDLQPCTVHELDDDEVRLPQNQSEGDIPQIGVVTGGCDNLECLARRIGLDDEEFTTDDGDGAVHLVSGSGGAGEFESGESYTGAEDWWSDEDTMMNYDVVLYACECTEAPDNRTQEAYEIFGDYLEAGGRAFLSHFGYEWLNEGPSWMQDIAELSVGFEGYDTVEIDTSHTEGQQLRDWMANEDAVDGDNRFTLGEARHSVQSINEAYARQWMFYPEIPQPNYFSFNTPIEVPEDEQCGRGVFADLHTTFGSSEPFPDGCDPDHELDSEDKAMVYMFFDLARCH